MKKIINLFALLSIVFAMVSCGADSSTPSGVAKKVAGCIQKGDYEGLVDCMSIGDKNQSDEEIAQQKEMFVNLLKEKAGEDINKKGGIKSFEVMEEKIAEDGNTAKVEMKYLYNDGTEETENLSFVKEDGKWLLRIDK